MASFDVIPGVNSRSSMGCTWLSSRLTAASRGDTVRMRGACTRARGRRNGLERQLARHGVKVGDVRYILHTHLHIDHAGKDDHFPMNTTVVINRREMEYSVSGLMHPQYPKPDIQHLVDPSTGIGGGSCVFGPFVPYRKTS